MRLHIGKVIKEQLEKVGMNKSEFARRLNTTPQNVYGIFKRSSIDTDLLLKISEVLEYNFFQHFTVKEPTNQANESKTVNEQNVVFKKLEVQNVKLEKEITNLKERLADKEKIIELLEKNK